MSAVAGISEAQVLSDFALQRMPDTQADCERVVRYAESVARELGVDREVGARLQLAARFHDIGKGAMPAALLTKPSAFTSGELVIMRHHVDVGGEILDATRSLADAAPAVRASHEWFGGGGYPRKLAGIDIPIESRIIAVADSYDAMTQKRASRVRVNSAEATAEASALRSHPIRSPGRRRFSLDARPTLESRNRRGPASPIVGPDRPTSGHFRRSSETFCVSITNCRIMTYP